MSKPNEDFFVNKHEWSLIKDDLLGSYLVPYATKMLATQKQLLYVDFFAGKGRFEDGSDGSPLIALRSLLEASSASRAPNPRITAVFFDANYADDLRRNIQPGFTGPTLQVEVACSRYEDALLKLEGSANTNAFLYIDPFGIKSLRMGDLVNTRIKFDSVEVLLNLNTFGFIREACRFYKVDLGIQGFIDDVPVLARPDDVLDDDVGTWLDDVAGGRYWRRIIERLIAGEIDGFRAEVMFSSEFCKQLMRGFRYVLNFPLRTNGANRPKYRMIHACNHPDGCMLMYERMAKAKAVWYSMREGGQLTLFERNAEEEFVDRVEVKTSLLAELDRLDDFVSLKIFLSSYLVENGVTCSIIDIHSILAELEAESRIEVKRVPPKTSAGNTSTFWYEKKGRAVLLRGLRHG